MTDKDLNDEFVCQATRIADELILSAKYSPNGVYWRINSVGIYYKGQNTNPDLTLYYGISGILLFMLEVFRVKKEDKYLSIIHQCASWIYHQSLLKQSSGFYGGRFGIVYTLLEIFKTTGNVKYIDWCHEITFDFESKNVLTSTNNLYSGLAGELLGLTHMLAIRSDPRSWNSIENNLKLLLDRSKTMKDGVYWEDPFIGFNNLSFIAGNLGIAYALKELWNLTEDKNIYLLHCKTSNFLQKIWDKFEHLAAGWNFSRELIFASQTGLHGFSRHLESIELTNKYFEVGQSNSIESGLAGEGLFALEIFRKNHKKVLLENTYAIAHRIACNLEKESMKNQRHGLFNGSTGIGYFFLKLVSQSDSIINPAVNGRIGTTIKHPIQVTNEFWLKKSYPFTLSALKETLPEEAFGDHIKSIATFNSMSYNDLGILISNNEPAQEILNIELAKQSIEEKYLFIDRNNVFLNLVRAKQKFEKGQFLTCTFRLNPNSETIELTPYAKKLFKTDSLLVCATTQGTKTYHLSSTDILILGIIKNKPSTVSDKLSEFKRHVDYSNSKEEADVKDFFIRQLNVYISREIIFLETGFLTKVSQRIKSVLDI